MRFGHLTGKFERRDCLLAADRWETVEKLIERVPGFKIVIEGLHGNARPHEHGCTTEDFWIAMYDRGSVGHGSCLSLEYTPGSSWLGG